MPNVVNYIFNSLDRNDKNIKNLKRLIIRNNRSVRNSIIFMELAIMGLAYEVYSNSKKIEKMEAEIKELKGE